MSAKSYLRGSNVIKSQIDQDIEQYMRRYNSCDPIAFIQSMREELDKARTQNDLLEAQVTALNQTLANERKQHAEAIVRETRRVNYFKALFIEARDALKPLESKHAKLSTIFRWVCTPERYHELSKLYDEDASQQPLAAELPLSSRSG